MNPILRFILKDAKDADANSAADDTDAAEDVVPKPDDGEQICRSSSPPPSISDSHSAATVDEKKYECKHEHDNSSSSAILPTTDLSRQNICRALQPGAFNVTPTRVTRVVAHNHRRRDSDEEGFEDIDIESAVSRNGTETRENNATGLIQAELVTAPSSSLNPMQMVPLGSIQRAEVVEPIDPSMIKKQLQEEQRQSRRFCSWNSGTKCIIVILFIAMALLVTYVVWELLPLRSSSNPPQDNSSPESISSSLCIGDKRDNICTRILNRYKQSGEPIPSSLPIDPNDRLSYEQQFNCTLPSPADFEKDEFCNDLSGNDRNSPCQSGNSNLNLKDICLMITDMISNSDEISDYTISEARNIARNCTDTEKVCDLWEHLRHSGDHGSDKGGEHYQD